MKRKLSAYIAITFVVFNAVLFLIPNLAIASDPQKCTQNETCKIGEFIYNDDYTENTTATCTVTSRDPSGSLYLNAQNLTQTNAYYSHSFTPTTLGTYPTQICCTVNAEQMCLDKTFEVVSVASTGGGSSLTAAEVWSYSDRSLTSFGSLVSDIWSNSSRSLTSFGDLVSNIWNHNDRSLTQSISVDTTNLVTKSDLAEIQKINKENRTLLEKLVNKPVIKSFIDDKQTPDLTSKLNDSSNVANNLFATIQNLKNRSDILLTNWNAINTDELKSELNQITSILGDQDSNNKNDNSVTHQVAWLKNTWNDPLFLSLSNTTSQAISKSTNLKNDLNLYTPDILYTSYQELHQKLNDLYDLTGNPISNQKENNVFSFLKKIQDRLTIFNNKTTTLENLLTKINNGGNVTPEINQTKDEILSINNVTSPENFINRPEKIKNKKTSLAQNQKNSIFGLIALINSNKLLIAGNGQNTIKSIWLEEGSIVFRTVAINPSQTISQNVDVKFYLPEELKKEHLIFNDPEVKIDYDPIEGSLYAQGQITLKPLESKTLTVETEDIWQFNQSDINILKKQAETLTDSLKKTAVYTQATSTKSDIDATLDKVMLRQKQAITPENRIKTYRESSLDVVSVQEKIDSLKTLISQTNTGLYRPNSYGNSKIISIIGIVILGVAGFAFFTHYTRLSRIGLKQVLDNVNDNLSMPKFHAKAIRHHHAEKKNIKAHRITSYIVIGLISGGIATYIASLGIYASRYNQSKKLSLETSQQIYQTKKITIKVPSDSRIPVKSSPSITSPEILSLKSDQDLYIYKKIDGWLKVGPQEIDTNSNWWISEQYTK